jgi:transcription initiation factor IIE alpha subunit
MEFKSCPKCNGDRVRVEEIDYSGFTCVQCGLVTYITTTKIYRLKKEIREVYEKTKRRTARLPYG